MEPPKRDFEAIRRQTSAGISEKTALFVENADVLSAIALNGRRETEIASTYRDGSPVMKHFRR